MFSKPKVRKIWHRLVAALPWGDVTLLIESGNVTLKRGKLRPHLREALEELIAESAIDSACIHATRLRPSGYRLSLFGIPAEHSQRLRNVWHAEAD